MNSDPQPTASSEYWKRKLAAYLHDSPDKVLSILDHESRARRIAGEINPGDRARKDSDWAASAADRLPFPPSAETRTPLTCFRHPLGGAQILLNSDKLPVGVAETISQTTRPVLSEGDARAAFITTWRFWRNWAASRHADFALYPAETRLPDHTIWNHLAVTSALQGCMGGEPWKPDDVGNVADSPAFLLFTVGPVQDFIAAARTTRDLWSGSYLLSYLIGHVLATITADFGPDHVIFPNLCDQPIMDLLMRDVVWEKVKTSGSGSLFDGFDYYGRSDGPDRLLTPSLPNRFLAVLPSRMTEHQDRGPQFASIDAYAKHLAATLRQFLEKEIAEPVAVVADETLGHRFDRARFSQQVQRMMEIHWQVLPWPQHFDEVEALTSALPADDGSSGYTPRAGLRTVMNLCQKGADKRYLENHHPKSVAAAWGALYSTTEWLLDGVKSNRAFAAASGGSLRPGKSNTRDGLNGREEAVLQVEGESDAKDLSARLEDRLGKGHLLKEGENLGAGTLIKRLWPFAVLCTRHAFEPRNLVMPNTRRIASHEPWSADDDEGMENEEKYFAVLALDGDSMGKWISGSKTPTLETVLSEECAAVYRSAGADLSNRRPLSPSWHLQFAEALGNFSQHAARRIVESFDGRLIYAGGDDVLAMLPADSALPCARALRLAFRGHPSLNDVARGILTDHKEERSTVRRSDRSTRLFQIDQEGFLKLTPEATDRHGEQGRLLDDPVRFPVIVPGPATDCSVGIAIAHFKAPLQDVVRSAQQAEKRAKNTLNRGAVSVSLHKRSGEIIEWGCRWDAGGLEVMDAILEAMGNQSVSRKFPHRVVELVERYLVDASPLSAGSMSPVGEFSATEVLLREFNHTIDRQGEDKEHPSFRALKQIASDARDADLRRYLDFVAQPSGDRPETGVRETPVHALIGLCQTAAFVFRNRSKDNHP